MKDDFRKTQIDFFATEFLNSKLFRVLKWQDANTKEEVDSIARSEAKTDKQSSPEEKSDNSEEPQKEQAEIENQI